MLCDNASPCTDNSLIFCDICFGQISTMYMYVVIFALLFIVVVIGVLSISCALTETLLNFSAFFGGRGVKKETKAIKFISDIDILTSPLKITKTANIKVVYLPTTTELQPLDQGIIQNFKQHYRKRFLRAVIAKAESGDTDMTTGKFITVLDAIHWIFSSIKDVKKQTVSSCFRKAGFPGVETEEHDPEDNMPLEWHELITAASKQLKIRDPMTAEEFVNTDKYVSVTEELGENWEKELVVEDFINNQNTDQDDENLPDSKPEESEAEEECTIEDLSSNQDVTATQTLLFEERTN